MVFSLRPFDIVIFFFCVFLLLKIRARRKYKGTPPPGPKGWPIIGNLFDMPPEHPWVTFSEWGRRYGGLVSVSMMGQPLAIITSLKVAVDLLDKRSAIYSDRPQVPSASAIGYTNVMVLMQYGDRFRDHRRMYGSALGSRSLVERYAPLQEALAHEFLHRLLMDPADFVNHIKLFTTEAMLLISYGYKAKGNVQDPYIQLAQQTSIDFGQATLPGAFLVDAIPALRYIPSWFPGGGWRKRVEEHKRLLDDARQKPHAYVKRAMETGTAEISFTSRILEEKRMLTSGRDLEEEISWANVALVGGGTDTTDSTLHSFFLAMTLYPEVQRKAQEEIDRIIGTDRLPTLKDRDTLPYVNAVCNELLRWMPVGPLALPHRLMEDDVYEGYFLQKGTILIPNLWAMLHDPETYACPTEFMPERYLDTPTKSAEPDPHQISFGFGRRLCPGMHVADAALFIATASVLATLNVEKAVENGVSITPRVAQTSGTISRPVHFKCAIKPRSAAAEALIRAAAENNEMPALHRV